MDKKVLILGYSAEDQFQYAWGDLPDSMQEVMQDGWGGGMIFAYENPTVYEGNPVGITLLSQIVTAEAGPNNWNQKPNCP